MCNRTYQNFQPAHAVGSAVDACAILDQKCLFRWLWKERLKEKRLEYANKIQAEKRNHLETHGLNCDYFGEKGLSVEALVYSRFKV
jgi:hypothetical protein